MPLANNYVNVYGQLPKVFQKIAEGQAPTKFTIQYLKDLGFGSTNYRSVIPLLKTLGFLSPDGAPTPRYHQYRNQAQSRRVMAEAIREAYADLFTIKAIPTDNDKNLIKGKFKSAHNATDALAKLMASTFYTLVGLADLTEEASKPEFEPEEKPEKESVPPLTGPTHPDGHRPTLHYNI